MNNIQETDRLTLKSGLTLILQDSQARAQIAEMLADLLTKYGADNPPPYPVTSVNGMTGDVVVPGGGGGAVDSVNGKTGVVVLDADDVGALPDTTVVPTKVSELTNDRGFVNATGAAAAAPVQSVNGQTGAVVLDADDVGALPDTTVIPEKVSDLTNDSGFVNATGAAAAAPVQSVNGQTGAVVLDAEDVGALPDTYNPKVAVALCETAGSDRAKVATCYGFRHQPYTIFQITFTNANTYSGGSLTLNVNGTGAYGLWINAIPSSASNHTLPAGTYLCSIDGNGYYQIRNDGIAPLQAYGNYSGQNPPPYPVRSVNGKTGAVVLDADDVGALPDSTQIPSATSDLTNDSGFVDSAGAAAAAPVQSVNGMTGDVVVPSGGEIESDSNYIKLPDGTLIQWAKVSVSAVGGASGSHVWTFPQAFYDTNYVVTATVATGTQVNTRSRVIASSYNTTDITVYWRNEASGSSYTVNIACIAVGRWKAVSA